MNERLKDSFLPPSCQPYSCPDRFLHSRHDQRKPLLLLGSCERTGRIWDENCR
ncbi:hypothetical protein Zymop_2048 (plasmid) [Zymomonas mobilis subsp. pomaceae ATCC 29192]|uniref:Uncharacterized protein n=1 Tax=Zymomonas mobilis subsp. pomaceae (strain ATCC 29192 / DSM 22645 / JCM 10191 / CCUG 17912 / NBRC 13757 / NCIMB 11200 / NRRL B-4491 / Barker I) TaxID=579138 RepID=F8EWI8_ZYMMT|nr:hypothetical protein Zymop_2048 [Zymomonas mobilis subsp. pomaceae ATCC 29192]